MARRERANDTKARNAASRITGFGRARRQSRPTLQPASQATPVATYSIAACDLDAGQWGVATQSKFLAVGAVVPWAEPHVGAIATQAYANPRYAPGGLRSAALLGGEQDGGYARLWDTVVELRVEGHERPLEELRRLYRLHEALFGETPREEWLTVDDALANELRERLAKLGYDGELEEAFNRWAGNVNLEERVDGVSEIDPVVLE